MSCELYGRINLGEGALKIEKTDLDEILVPDFELFSANDIDELDAAFKCMAKRSPLPIEKEVQQADRRRIDTIINRVLKLAPGADEEIRQAVVELSDERALVSELRRERSSARVQRDTVEVTHEIVSQVLPSGIKRFPEEFVMVGEASQKIRIPSAGMELVSAPRMKHQADIFAGKPVYVVRADENYKAEFDDPETVEFVYLAQDGEEREVLAPMTADQKRRVIDEYKVYVRTIENTLERAIRERVLDGKLVRGIVQQVMESTGLKTEQINLSPRPLKRASAEKSAKT